MSGCKGCIHIGKCWIQDSIGKRYEQENVNEVIKSAETGGCELYHTDKYEHRDERCRDCIYYHWMGNTVLGQCKLGLRVTKKNCLLYDNEVEQ